MHASLLGEDMMSDADLALARSRSASASASAHSAAAAAGVIEQLKREEQEKSYQQRRERAESAARRNPFGSDADANEEDDDSSSYRPPGLILPTATGASDVTGGGHSWNNGHAREMRSPSFSAYTFSPHADPRSRPLSPPGVALDDLNNDESEKSVSATDLERAVLAAGAEHDGPPGPLLLGYKKSESSIRKDFTTVDWFFARSQMHRVRRLLRETNRIGGWKGKLQNIFLAAQGWIVLFLVGVLTAFSASIIHSVSAWLSDLKGGYCSGHNIFATRRVCQNKKKKDRRMRIGRGREMFIAHPCCCCCLLFVVFRLHGRATPR